MNNDLQNRIKQIDTENFIWIIYLIIIALSYKANYYEKDYFINKNNNSKNKYIKINSLVFLTLVLVYIYFENDALKSLKNKTQAKYDNLSFIATTLVLIAGLIFLYISINDTNIETEIAFN
ncbi:MAG: hypothetical protein IJ097_03305 [Bacilli bacterium]|nr:hypothetical protein [Bacilli bacterium]